MVSGYRIGLALASLDGGQRGHHHQASSVGPQDAEELALADGERHPVYDANRAVGLHQAVDLDRRGSPVVVDVAVVVVSIPGAGRTGLR
jgi:hypothetical protein